MRKPASSTLEDLVSIRVPKKLAGKKVVLVDAAEYAALKRRLAEVSDGWRKYHAATPLIVNVDQSGFLSS